MVDVNYQKRKNTELFNQFQDEKVFFLSKAQNYIPIYSRFFSLNDKNYNGINLNHKWYISEVKEKLNENCYHCKITNIETNEIKDDEIFFKFAPLLDPYKYLIGKYNPDDKSLFTLPNLNSDKNECSEKIIDCNNSAYIDGLFIYLTNQFSNDKNVYFPHSLDYYGSFLGIKNNYKINVFDDIDYLNNSIFFNKNKNILFTIDEYNHLITNNSKSKLTPIIINHNKSIDSVLSAQSFDNEIFEDIFEKNEKNEKKIIDLNDLKNNNINDLIDITDCDLHDHENQVSLKSNSTCSSRSSHTEENRLEDVEDEDEDDDVEGEGEDEDSEGEDVEGEDVEGEDSECEGEGEDSEDSEDSEDEEIINATIPKFPIQIISMESCEDTFDNLIMDNDLKITEWYSAFMQIIMILITYQKVFNFTHNDLHTNNVMYNTTDKKYIYYCYKKKYYRVPTFGRIFKIIDFGRSIYKYDGKIFCSDSFQMDGDAGSQYNTEPYLNEKKPRLEPNYSFDLCRLACSIFDYLVDDIREVKNLQKCNDPIKRLITEWCMDDKGINMLYKNNGNERYPDFKLYKMIARCVHNHTPQNQLERPEFKAFLYNEKIKPEIKIINIDNMPVCV